MDILNFSSGLLTGYLVPFLLVITPIIVVHEFGHYLVGRWCGIGVDVFSVGFGPEILGVTDRHGTRWRIAAVPLGGYVRFRGDENAASTPDFDGVSAMSEEDRRRTLVGASVWKRVATVAAGPMANFLMAIVIFAAMFGYFGKRVTDPIVDTVVPDSAAIEAGIVPGDFVLAIDGRPVGTFDDIVLYVAPRPEVSMRMTIERAGETLDVPITPRRIDDRDRFGNPVQIGRIGITASISAGRSRMVELSGIEALAESVRASWNVIDTTVSYLGRVIAGKEKADQLSGPIRVAKFSGQAAEYGIATLVQLAAFLSVSIGFVNLLPIPMLDGGHLVFYLIEIVRGRPVAKRVQEIAFSIGLGLIVILTLFVAWNDISFLAAG